MQTRLFSNEHSKVMGSHLVISFHDLRTPSFDKPLDSWPNWPIRLCVHHFHTRTRDRLPHSTQYLQYHI